MLKRLFTSSTRVKLLTLFLINPDEEYFIRELTRKLDEQINSIRRELDNLKKLGLLKSKERNRKKYYIVNKNFVIFQELRSIILKAISDKDTIAKKLADLGNLDVIVLSGIFVQKNSPIDLLLVGDINRSEFEEFLNTQMESKDPIRFSIMTKEDFLYRRQCKDKFLNELLEDPENIIALNKLEKINLEGQN